MAVPRLLGVLLCYNDGDILADSLTALLENNHHVIAWNHGSTDETAAVLERFRGELLEVTDISRSVDFYDMYPLMSKHLRQNYIHRYDWISWPDQDEILEGPTREKRYCDFLDDAIASPHAWIEFNDFVYWFTSRDDPAAASPRERVRYYSLARHGPPKIRSWRASSTNIRWFNHNKTDGTRYPLLFNLRHYPMRSPAQMRRRIAVDRAGLQHGPVNFHYENMKAHASRLEIDAAALKYDDGRTELDSEMNFDWTHIYGSGPKLSREVVASYLLSTRRWEIGEVLQRGLSRLPPALVEAYGADRLQRWLRELNGRISCPVFITIKPTEVSIITEEMARQAEGSNGAATPPRVASKSTSALLGGLQVTVMVDGGRQCVRVFAETPHTGGAEPLVALVPSFGGDEPRVARLEGGVAEFSRLRSVYYYLSCEPLAGES